MMNKMTAEDKASLIEMHKMLSMFDDSSAPSAAMFQTLGKGLHDGAMTKDDVCDIISACFDEGLNQNLFESHKKEEEVGMDSIAGILDMLFH